ncbi:MAG: hypothetical protein MIO87_02790 [Methanomassiliicoccales archaeon]|nr:hypothetical protein [Methanomassiliicoccales archaeon]
MNGTEALDLVKGHVSKEGNLKHMIAVGAVMRQTAQRMSQDQDIWEVTGILHDIDFEECHGMEDHALIAKDILSGKVSEEIVQAILAHNYEATGVPVDNDLKRALIAADAVSGLVIACALVIPSKSWWPSRSGPSSRSSGTRTSPGAWIAVVLSIVNSWASHVTSSFRWHWTAWSMLPTNSASDETLLFNQSGASATAKVIT